MSLDVGDRVRVVCKTEEQKYWFRWHVTEQMRKGIGHTATIRRMVRWENCADSYMLVFDEEELGTHPGLYWRSCVLEPVDDGKLRIKEGSTVKIETRAFGDIVCVTDKFWVLGDELKPKVVTKIEGGDPYYVYVSKHRVKVIEEPEEVLC